MVKDNKIEIKNRNYYFYNDIISIEEFNSNLLKIDKKSFQDIDIYYIGLKLKLQLNHNCKKLDHN